MTDLAVIPVLVGPLQALMAVLPALLLALAGAMLALFKPSTVKKLALLLWSQKLVVLPLAAAIFGLVWYWGALFPTTGSAGAREGAADTWLLWRGGLGRRAVVLSETPEPARGQVQWQYDAAPMATCYSSPAVVGNRVYITGSDFKPPFKDRGAIFSLDADTGELVWQFAAEGYRATFSSPAISGDRLIVGEGLHETRDARIYCIDLAASEAAGRGVKLWSLRTGSHVESSPCIYEGRAYIGAGDDGFYCLDLEGDGDGNPKVIWHVTGDAYLDCEPSAAAYDGRVYFGLGKGGKAVVCLDAETGEPLWRVPTPYPAFGSPAIGDGKIVVGMGNGNYIQSAEEIADGVRKDITKTMHDDGADQAAIDSAVAEATRDIFPAGEVWCLDAATGDVVWKYTDVERTVLGSPAIADGRVYVASRDKKLHCISLDAGEPMGRFDAGAPMVSAPAVGDENIYVVTQTGLLYGVGRQSLRPVWSVNLNASTVSSPVVARGHVYIGVDIGGLLCVGEPGGVAKTPLWAGRGGGGGKSGWADGSAIPTKVSSAWRYKPGGSGTVTSPAACIGDTLYVGVHDGETMGLARLSIEADGPALTEPQRRWLVQTTHSVTSTPVVIGERVMFIDGVAGDEGRFLRCVDAGDGNELWRKPLAADAPATLAATDRWLFCVDGPQSMSAYDLAGNDLWMVSGCRIIGEPVAAGDLLFVVDADRLMALDAPTGQVLWTRPVAGQPTTGPVMAAGKLWLGCAEGIRAYDPVTGERVLWLDGVQVSGRLLCDDEKIIVTRADQLLYVDAATCLVPDFAIDDANVAVAPVLAGDTLVYSDGEALRRFDLTDGTSVLLTKLYPKYYGAIVGELIVTRSHILVATEKRGLICLRPKAN